MSHFLVANNDRTVLNALWRYSYDMKPDVDQWYVPLVPCRRTGSGRSRGWRRCNRRWQSPLAEFGRPSTGNRICSRNTPTPVGPDPPVGQRQPSRACRCIDKSIGPEDTCALELWNLARVACPLDVLKWWTSRREMSIEPFYPSSYVRIRRQLNVVAAAKTHSISSVFRRYG